MILSLPYPPLKYGVGHEDRKMFFFNSLYRLLFQVPKENQCLRQCEMKEARLKGGDI
jgi:hypothetical protein